MTEALFLNEAVQHQRDAAYGHAMDFLQPSTTVVFFALITTLAGAVLFLHSNSYTRKLELTGQIDDRHIARVSAQIDGRVVSLYVAEGQQVEKNALLGMIEGQAQEASRGQLEELEKQHTQLALNRKSHFLLNDLQLTRSRTQLTSVNEQIDQQSALLALHRQTVSNFRYKYQAAVSLKDAGHFTQQDWVQLQQEELTHQQQGLRLRQHMSTLVQKRNDVKQSLQELRIKFEQELIQLDGRLSVLRQTRLRVIEQDHQRLLAPVAGTITLINMKPGMEVTRGDLLVSIEPEVAIATVTLLAPSHSHRFLEPGNPVRLRVQDLPDDQLGFVDGRIIHISDHPVSLNHGFNNSFNNSVPMFVVRVALENTHFEVNKARFPLKSGMSLTCTIELETYSLLEWISHPIRFFNEAG